MFAFRPKIKQEIYTLKQQCYGQTQHGICQSLHRIRESILNKLWYLCNKMGCGVWGYA